MDFLNSLENLIIQLRQAIELVSLEQPKITILCDGGTQRFSDRKTIHVFDLQDGLVSLKVILQFLHQARGVLQGKPPVSTLAPIGSASDCIIAGRWP